MPLARRQRKRQAKKAPLRRRKAKYSKTSALATRMKGPGFSDMVYVKLNYVDQITVNPLAAAVSIYSFRGNSLFDPDFTGTGHQPLYFDQYTAVYNRYRVLGSSIMVDAINLSAGSASYMVIEPNTETSSASTVPQLLEQGRAQSTKVIPVASRISVRHKQFCSTRKATGATKSQVYDDTYDAAMTSNPGQQWYWNILFASADLTTTVNVTMIVKLTFYVQLFDRKQAAQS